MTNIQLAQLIKFMGKLDICKTIDILTIKKQERLQA